MYLQNIAIKYIGPIDELFVEMPFTEDCLPKPIVFVGENGSGKTILQSQIIDGLYEIGADLFDDVGKQSVLKRKYYKVSGGINLQIGKEKGFSALTFIDNSNNKIEYLDKIGEIKKEDINELLSDFKLTPSGKKDNQKETTNLNESQKENLQDEWLAGAYFYQPAYRYEEPFWKTEPFLDRQRFKDKRRYVDELKKEIEIVSSTKENKSYLLDFVLDVAINPKNTIDRTNWNNINNVLRKIKRKENIGFSIGPRGWHSRISIVEKNSEGKEELILPSIDNLSLGESVLLNLFINIIRHGDKPPKDTKQIKGLVAIDEVDVHLHTDLQNIVLPELIKLFPRVQFIITTHSPLFLLGMRKVFGDDGFEIRNMPDGDVITTERFSEFENAYAVLKETEKFENDFKKRIAENKKPKVYVEGPTDVKYIEKAYELYNKTDELSKFDIEIIGEETDTGTKGSNNIALKNAGSFLKTNTKILSQKVLLLNDPEENISSESFEDLLFVDKMPKYEDNLIKKGIENLFGEEIISRARKGAPDVFCFYTVGTEEKNLEIIKDKKKKLCDWICENGTKDDFKNFKKIFEIIEQIIESGSKR